MNFSDRIAVGTITMWPKAVILVQDRRILCSGLDFPGGKKLK
jgi:hypothetical protein